MEEEHPVTESAAETVDVQPWRWVDLGMGCDSVRKLKKSRHELARC